MQISKIIKHQSFLMNRTNSLSEAQKIKNLLFSKESDRKKNTLITPYHWPDSDGVASAYALERLLIRNNYSQVQSMISQTPQIEAKWLMEKLGFLLPEIKFADDQQIICVDVSDAKDLPSDLPLDKIIAVIDHHPISELHSMPNAIGWVQPVGAAATLIAKLYNEQEITPEPLIATLLHAAIMSNTISLHTNNTTIDDKQMAQWTQSVGSVDSSFIEKMFYAKSDLSKVDLYSHIHEDLSMKPSLLKGKKTSLAQLEIIGVRSLLEKRRDELMNALQMLKEERKADSIFLTAIDLMEFKTYFLFTDPLTQQMLHSFYPLIKGPHYDWIDAVITRKDVQSYC